MKRYLLILALCGTVHANPFEVRVPTVDEFVERIYAEEREQERNSELERLRERNAELENEAQELQGQTEELQAEIDAGNSVIYVPRGVQVITSGTVIHY